MALLASMGQSPLLRTLRYRDLRLLALSSGLWFAARWMQVVIINWLVLEQTNSPLMLGLVNGARFAGNIIAPFTGALADRFNRRRILIIAEMANTVAAGLFLVLLVTDRVEIWHAFGMVMLSGVLQSFDFPARNALIADQVPRAELTNAVGVNRAASDMTSVLGPILGGSFIALAGFAGAYAIIVLINLVDLLVLLRMRGGEAPLRSGGPSVWHHLAEGWRECRRNRPLLAVLTLAALANLLTFPLTNSLMPVFARDVLGVGAARYGMLTASVGMGAFLASLGFASRRPARHRGWLMVVSFVLWALLMVSFATMRRFYPSLPLLVALGISQGTAMVTSHTFLLERASPSMRGQVMGLRALAVSPLPLGNLVGGAIAQGMGAPAAVMLYGSVAALSMAAIGLSIGQLRRWR